MHLNVFDYYANKLKAMYKLKTDSELTDILCVSQPTISYFKRNNKIPFEKIINRLLADGESLDLFFDSKDSKKDVQILKNCIFFIDRPTESISFPGLVQNTGNSKKAFKWDSYLFIFDSKVTKYSGGGIYILNKEDYYFVKKIEIEINGSYRIKSFDSENEWMVMGQDEMATFSIAGKVQEIFIYPKEVYI